MAPTLRQTCIDCGRNRSEVKFTHAARCRDCWNLYQRRWMYGELPPIESRVCAYCAETYTPIQRRPSAFCSRDCKTRAWNAESAAKRLAAKPQRHCQHCGTEIPQEKFVTAAFCNAKCSSAAHNVTRKLRRRGADPDLDLISRAAIAKRDGWRCGICGKKVRQDLEHPDPYCASIDHVVPLARGGDNSPANLQLAHLRCNLSKRADGVIQPRLI